jgi:ASCH domain
MPRAEEKKHSGFPAISLRQPNADRVIRGKKRRDTRSRPTRFRGWILVHASLAKSAGESTDRERGKLLGLVQLENCVKEGDGWTYAWKSPRRFRTAIACRGHYSIPFYVPGKLVRGTPAEKVTPGALAPKASSRGA